jgi:uncharacterized protein (TIGR02246 family)
MIVGTDLRPLIESANSQFTAAFERRDAAAIASLYTQEAQLLPPNSDFVRGPEAIRTFWQGVLNMGLDQATLETIDVEAHGDTAIEVGRYSLFAKGLRADSGKYIVIWKHDAGTWRLHRDMWSSSAPPAA